MHFVLKVFSIAMVVAVALAQVRVAKPQQEAPVDSVARPERQAGGGHHHDAVDFGAHTGHKGAFGWHADFPVHTHN